VFCGRLASSSWSPTGLSLAAQPQVLARPVSVGPAKNRFKATIPPCLDRMPSDLSSLPEPRQGLPPHAATYAEEPDVTDPTPPAKNQT
jgi:hypothetical protein